MLLINLYENIMQKFCCIVEIIVWIRQKQKI